MPFSTAAAITAASAQTAAAVAAPVFAGAAFTTTVSTSFLYGATAATIAADAALAAGAVGMFSTLQAGEMAEQLGKDQRMISEFNAELDEREAEQKLDVAGAEEIRHRKAGAAFKAEQRAGYAKAGVTLEGTPMDFLEEQAIRLEGDALNIRRSGSIGYQDSMVSADLNRYAGRTAFARGRNQRRGSYATAAAQGVGSLGRAYSFGSRRQSLS